MNKENFVDFDAELKSTLRPRIAIKVGGKMLHFKRNANIMKSMATFIKYQTGKLIAQDDPGLPTELDERSVYIMSMLLDEDKYEMRLSFLNVMFSETFNEERMDELLEFYQAEGLDVDDKDELAIWLLNRFTPMFMEELADTQKPKPSRKKKVQQ